MKKKNFSILLGVLAVLAVVATLVLVGAVLGGQVGGGHCQDPRGHGPGHDPSRRAQGFMGIPGAPHHFCLFYILWGIWVGWIFSSVGAFGGVMAGVGHITVFGLSDYAATFKKTSPTLEQDAHRLHPHQQPVPGGIVGVDLFLYLLSHGTAGAAPGLMSGRSAASWPATWFPC